LRSPGGLSDIERGPGLRSYTLLMKMAFWCLLLMAGTVRGEAVSDEFVGRLAGDLAGLKDLPAATERLHNLQDLSSAERTTLRSFVAEMEPEQDRIMKRFGDDAADRYGEPVLPWDFSYALTTVLMGRDLGDQALRRIASFVVMSMDVALECRTNGSPIRSSAKFRAATELGYRQLLAVGVEDGDARVVIDCLLKAGLQVSNGFPERPLVRPIPPAHRLPN
jgi:hypothetical protein